MDTVRIDNVLFNEIIQQVEYIYKKKIDRILIDSILVQQFRPFSSHSLQVGEVSEFG
jgi:hypothetical protein